jgi:hypothetical protein
MTLELKLIQAKTSFKGKTGLNGAFIAKKPVFSASSQGAQDFGHIDRVE